MRSVLHVHVVMVLVYWTLCSFLFSFSGVGEEQIVFDLSSYDIYLDYGDDDSGLDFPTDY